MCANNYNNIERKNHVINFDDFARQMVLKYRVAVAVAAVKTKPDNVSIDQHLNIIRDKIVDDADSDSDMTVCSDDFKLSDGNGEEINGEAANVNHGEVATQDSDVSANILDGFNLEKLVYGDDDEEYNDELKQVISSVKMVTDDPKVDKVNEPDTQIGTLDDHQSQNLLQEFVIVQSGLTFYESDAVGDDGTISDAADGDKKNVLHNNTIVNDDNLNTTKYDSQQTELYSLRDYTIYNNTHISQSQTQYVEISHNQLFNAHNSRNDGNREINKPKDLDTATQTPENFDEFGDHNKLKTRDGIRDVSKANDKTDSKDTQTNDDGMDDDEMDDTEEIIPFKVVEELNRVKVYLDKRNRDGVEECATDSGYRSDSQKRSYKGCFEQEKWLNQSAQCMVNFLATCPMVPRAKDIISDVSISLGRVVDRMHADEKYPAFIEEILDQIQKLLKDVNENDGSAADVILQMDVKISRLLLLNSSHHIIKYTIEKITTSLEKLNDRMNEDKLLELTNTSEMENGFYMLHVLELLLRRQSETRVERSPASTQQSLDERCLRRSSITDIWRRKWMNSVPAAQAPAAGLSMETRCSETLNRLIVDAMSRYSLISFAALQCFNILKN